MTARQVIIVGGGLSGLSAAHTVLENGGNALIIDKNSFMGGNSTKATSGINGALTKTQINLGIKDSAEQFYEDTAKSARELLRPELVQVLTGNSASAVEWLQKRFNLDLSKVSRLGGHSFPRTHRGKERFPGMTITYALMEKFEEIAEAEPHRARCLTKARVTQLIKDNAGEVIGVVYEKDGQTAEEYGPVIIATGGYAADFSDSSLLKKYRPEIYDLPTTNGDYSTGDGIKLASAIGANTIDLEMVQVHPTGLVDPKEPDAKVKFLAAEALRGVGGILVDRDGYRFCDELGHRDYVTGEMWKRGKAPYRLILNKGASQEIEWHCKHYVGRGLMEKFPNGRAFAEATGISPQTLDETFRKYNEVAEKKTDPFGKKYFSNVPFFMDDEFHVSVVTPVLHFTMGGIEINNASEVLGPQGKPVNGLFGAGEVCGGVHGANRLGGSSLLGCVVFGRVAGGTASRYLFGKLINSSGSQTTQSATRRIATIGQHLTAFKASVQSGLTTHVEVDPEQKQFTMHVTWDDKDESVSMNSYQISNNNNIISSSSPTTVTTKSPTSVPAAKPAVDANKEYTWEEVAKHNTEQDCWVVVNGQVLDVTHFLKDHPGGKKAILIYAGRDATEEFNMLHKPNVVAKYAPESIIGKIAGDVH